MDELMKAFLGQAPFVAVLLYQLNIVYSDWKIDRTVAQNQRENQAAKLDLLNTKIDKLIDKIDGLYSPSSSQNSQNEAKTGQGISA